MPAAIADKVRDGEQITARDHSNVTVIYADIGDWIGCARS